jgi:SAM-dependent methyltransferase
MTRACPICGGERFEAQGRRDDARCVGCGALERHRALARMYATLLDPGEDRTALEVGPRNRQVFGDHLRARGWHYLATDSSRRGNPNDPRIVDFIDFEADLRALTPVATGSIELLIAQHVIEEISDYAQALAEIARVLAPAGTALLEIPFDPARERSREHPPDNFGNIWSFGRELLGVVEQYFAEVEVGEYRDGLASGRILACRGSRPNPVAVENALPGDATWWGPRAPAHAVEGYASECSVRPGGRLELHISTRPAERYRITVHRLGWYGGAGGRAVAVHPGPGSDLRGLPREMAPIAPGPEIASAQWPVTDVIPVGERWTTGVYVARLELTTGAHAGSSGHVPFVVRPPLGTVADILVQQPVTTAQAYNNAGGKSMYTSNSTDEVAAVKVTFDRPFPAWHEANLNARWPFIWDLQLLRFLEREGFDLSYTTDVDTHREPWSVTGHRLLMTSGHDEYWTAEMRDAFDRAQAEGTNIACMGANTCYWQIRFEDGERTMVEFRRRDIDPEPDRALKTEQFRHLEPARPECRLFGVQYQDGMTRSGQPPRDYELAEGCQGHPWLDGTGFGHPAKLHDLVGYEWDAIQAGAEPPDATVFFHYDCPELSPADAVAHRAESGALVFAAGSLQFSWGLDDWGHDGHADERLQRFMRNVLRALTAR